MMAGIPAALVVGIFCGRFMMMQGKIMVSLPADGWVDQQNLLEIESYVLPNEKENDMIRVNINEADEEELDQIPGIGPALAKRIVEYRQENGPFESKEELRAVNGIGEVLYHRMEEWVTLE